MTDRPRELTEILYEMDCAERAVPHARLGLTPEDPLEATTRLGELAKQLEQFRVYASDASATDDSAIR